MKMAKPDQKNLPPEFVLSRAQGWASEPKDFEWLRINIPCQAACPAGTDIPGYLDAIAHGDFKGAYLSNLRDNVFPAVLGRVCTRPCEPPCRHGWEGLGEPVAICHSKRAAADWMQHGDPIALDPLAPPTGKHVAVIGAGAAGLTVARQLCLYGHQVTVFERGETPGGLMVQGIPPFRLPRDWVAREIEQIEAVGVRIQCNVEVGKAISLEALWEQHDAVVVAAGTHAPQLPDCPGIDLPGVQHGLEFLKAVHQGEEVPVGKQVIVIGGGFTAVDCARTVQRLGASSVRVLYRRSEAEMYISGHEIAEMKREGIAFEPLTLLLACEIDANGRVGQARVASVLLGEPDESGRRRPEVIPGSETVISADQVLLATGQQPDIAWLEATVGNLDRTGYQPSAHRPDLFLAGDVALGALSLIDAIGHAKECARRVDTFLMGAERWREAVWIEDAKSTGRTREMDEIPRQSMPTQPVAERRLDVEVESGLDREAAQTEAQRCYLCHYKYEIDNDLCIYCDRCLKVKPVENCIVKISALEFGDDGRITGYKRSVSADDYNLLYIDQNECIRCGACADVCPVECIPLQKVTLRTMPLTEAEQ